MVRIERPRAAIPNYTSASATPRKALRLSAYMHKRIAPVPYRYERAPGTGKHARVYAP